MKAVVRNRLGSVGQPSSFFHPTPEASRRRLLSFHFLKTYTETNLEATPTCYIGLFTTFFIFPGVHAEFRFFIKKSVFSLAPYERKKNNKEKNTEFTCCLGATRSYDWRSTSPQSGLISSPMKCLKYICLARDWLKNGNST